MNSDRIATLKTFISKEPDNPFNSYALAMEYYEHKTDESLKILKELVIIHPGYLPTYFKLAHLYWEFGKCDLAEDVFTKGIELAKEQNDQKALSELKSAYGNFQFEKDE